MKYPEPESNTLEFKIELPQKGQIIKTIIGFCNQFGGRLIIGVDDNRNIIGINPDEIDLVKDQLADSIYKSTTPSIIPLIYTESINNKILLIIEVSRGMQPPYFITNKGLNNGTYIRLGASTVKAKNDFINELRWSSRGLSFDQLPAYQAKIIDLDKKEIVSRVPRKFGLNATISSTQLKSTGMICEENGQVWPSIAGVLLFTKRPQEFFSEAVVTCTRFKGIEGREILASQDCEGNLFEQIELAYHFTRTHLNISSSIVGIKRIDVLEIPEIALREGIINAVVHRHYGIASPVKIAIFDNRVEIFSPGNFPGPINAQKIELGVTYVRNKTLVNLMREAGVLEKLGSGLKTIFSSFEKACLEKPELREGEAFVKLVLPRIKIDYSAPTEKKILEIISKEGPKSISDLVHRLGESKSTMTRRVNALLENKQLDKVGNTRNRVYQIKV